MEKNNLIKNIIVILEILFFIILIVIIVYLIKSDNGIIGTLNKKSANNRLNEIMLGFTQAEDDVDLEEYLRETNGVEIIEVNRLKGIIKLKIEEQEITLVIDQIEQEKMDAELNKE